MAKRKRYTVNQKEYIRLAEELQRKAERILQQGGGFKSFGLEDNLMKAIYNPQQLPKRVYKRTTLKELQQLVDSGYIEYVLAIDRATGEILRGQSAVEFLNTNKSRYVTEDMRQTKQKLKNQIHDRFVNQVDKVIDNTRLDIDLIENNYIRDLISDTINDSVTIVGKKATAQIINQMYKDGRMDILTVVYASNQYKAGLSFVMMFNQLFNEYGGEGLFTEDEIDDVHDRYFEQNKYRNRALQQAVDELSVEDDELE